MTDGRRARDGQTTLARRMCDRRARSSVHRASVALLWRLRCAVAAHPSRNRRLSAAQPPSIRHKAEISLIIFRPYDAWTAGARRTDDARARMRDGCTSASHCRRASAALPPHIRRASVVCPPCSRRPSVIRPKSASSKRLCIVGVSLQCGQFVVFVAVAVVASSSHARRAVVALSSHCRRTVVASSWHRRRIVAVPSLQRRRVVTFRPSNPSSYTRNHTPHVFRA